MILEIGYPELNRAAPGSSRKDPGDNICPETVTNKE
jgi:hypothetical protein